MCLRKFLAQSHLGTHKGLGFTTGQTPGVLLKYWAQVVVRPDTHGPGQKFATSFGLHTIGGAEFQMQTC